MMTIAAYVHSILPILQVCRSKEEIGTKSQKSKNLNERNQKRRSQRTERGIPARETSWDTTLSHGNHLAERASERARSNVVLHDIPSYYTKFFGFDGAKKSREKSRSTRHLKTRPTTFFGRTADHANNCVLHDI